MFPILTGLAAGGLHVFSGVDHLAALAPAAVENPSGAAKTGIFWGLGHGIGVMIIGGLGLALRGLVDVESWSSWAEFLVGFLLIGIGTWAMFRAGSIEIHEHPHSHDGTDHEHVHAHTTEQKSHHHAALGVGIFHGVAGGGHLFGVLPALALPLHEAIVYLLSYLVASVAAMGLFAYGIGALAGKTGEVWIRRLMYGSGALAAIVGVLWVYTTWPF